MHPVRSRIRFSTLLLLASFAPCFGASPPDSAINVQVRWLQTPAPDLMSTQLHNVARIEQWLRARGVTVADKAEWIVWCDLVPVAEDNGHVLVSIGIGRALPRKMIELGKKSEILFKGASKQNDRSLPGRGKWVRERLTEDFLYEFIFPLEQASRIVTRASLDQCLDDEVHLLFQRHFAR